MHFIISDPGGIGLRWKRPEIERHISNIAANKYELWDVLPWYEQDETVSTQENPSLR